MSANYGRPGDNPRWGRNNPIDSDVDEGSQRLSILETLAEALKIFGNLLKPKDPEPVAADGGEEEAADGGEEEAADGGEEAAADGGEEAAADGDEAAAADGEEAAASDGEEAAADGGEEEEVMNVRIFICRKMISPNRQLDH